MKLLEDLNPSQVEAVTHVDGPLLVIAGAGTGKTRVITRRIAYMIHEGIAPWNILAITFTKKAAGEMKERVAQLGVATGAWVSTFHSMCVQMLRPFADLVGLRASFTIYDADDQKKLYKQILQGQREFDEKDLSLVMSVISRAKNELVSPSLLEERGENPAFVGIYRAYQAALRKANAMDFDDLLYYVAKLLLENEDYRRHWTDRFRYVLVDEYQDTNHAQYVIVRELAKERGNVCATGDPDQAIYTWRGADIRNILDFEHDFPNAKVVKLERNYRSTKTILRAASEMIRNNTERKERELYTDKVETEPIKLLVCRDDEEEAEHIAAEVLRLQEDGVELRDMAVFYRTNAQSRVFEKVFSGHRIPYVLIGAVGFYERKEVKDILAYLRVLVNDSDNVSLARILNVPPRGIGNTSISRLETWAEAHGTSLLTAVREAETIQGMPARAKQSLREFLSLLDQLRTFTQKPVADLVEATIKNTRYVEMLEASGKPEDMDRIDNLEELQRAAAIYDAANPERGLAGFLEDITLLSDVDKYDENANAVPLMTLHCAKGLEFRVVFLSGLVDGLLPHYNSMETQAEIEEERRLCYVGMTRAKEKLYLTYPLERSFWGASRCSGPSRFLSEIPPDTITPGRRVTRVRRTSRRWNVDGDDEDEADRSGRHPGERGAAGAEPPQTDARARTPSRSRQVSGFSPGERVNHNTFGPGRVVQLEGSGEQAKAIVRFDDGYERKLMLKYANLTKI